MLDATEDKDKCWTNGGSQLDLPMFWWWKKVAKYISPMHNEARLSKDEIVGAKRELLEQVVCPEWSRVSQLLE